MDSTAQAREIDTLLGKYSESHLNHTNELIHFVCVPVIVFSLLGIVWAIHPLAALAVTIAAMVYYIKLSPPFAIGMLLMAGAMLGLLSLMPKQAVLPLSIAIFVLAWIGQFIGHKIEGKKPSFLDDLRFLLIGPVFVLSFLYRRLKLAW
ncbi:MAG: Mpo1-like protein [Pseudomonadota bacterium]